MNFLYIDESGIPNFNHPDPIFCITGIDVSDNNCRPLIYEYESLKKYYFPALYSIPLRKIPVIKDKIKILEKREIKDIINPQNFCYRNRKFMHKVFDVCTKYNVKVFGVISFKDRLPQKDPGWLYHTSLMALTGVYHKALLMQNTKGIIIMDSRGQSMDDDVTFIQSSYLLWGKVGRQFDRVIELPFFTRSHLSSLLQLAHFCAYITACHYNYEIYYQQKYKYIDPLWVRLTRLYHGMPRGKNFIVWA